LNGRPAARRAFFFLSPSQVIRDRRRDASVGTVKKALVVVAAVALVVSFWLGAANALSATRHDAKRPVTGGASASTEVLRVQYQEVQVDYQVDMHDGGVWGQPSGESQGG
jgi:hypothetical protein